MASIKKTSSWKTLEAHLKSIKDVHMRDLFSKDENRFKKNHILFDDFLVDYSKNRITEETKKNLISLAKEANIENWRDKLFSGDKINFTENRSVLHVALRNRSNKPIYSDGKDVMPDVNASLKKMKFISEAVRSGEWKGFTGEKIRTVVNIGIGGSDLGPSMACKALKPYGLETITPLFVSNVDGADLAQILENCDANSTLFIVASKTFTTQETMTNAFSSRKWLVDKLGSNDAIQRHFIAISSNKEAVHKFGISTENMFGISDWVGGRYSLWSPIGLSIAIYIGMNNFEDLLQGGYEADMHFQSAPLEKNIPVMLALIGIWNINFFGYITHAVLPYDHGLSLLPSYLQQADMESNGKFIDRDGEKIKINTGPILWGEAGTNGQHAFYQLLHQGTQIVPSDFIMPIKSHYEIGESTTEHHKILMSNFIAQTQSLMKGKTEEDVRAELVRSKEDITNIESLIPHLTFEGNRPSTSILFESLTPKTLGKILAIYEHKIFTQGIIWNINSFDQWGVEYGKQIARMVLPKLLEDTEVSQFDSSTNNLINYIKNIK